MRSDVEQPVYYALDFNRTAPVVTHSAAAAKPKLIVTPTQAAAGFDTAHIIYMQRPHELEFFSKNEWVDTPARMLTPLIVSVIAQRDEFGAVMPTPSAAVGDMRLDTEIIALQHEFVSRPSAVRFVLRAYVVDNKTRRVLASRDFSKVVLAASDNPLGGVNAANKAV